MWPRSSAQMISGQTSRGAEDRLDQSVRPGTDRTSPRPAGPAGSPGDAAAGPPAHREGFTGPASEFSGFITIQPDERTNSVVVSGTLDDLRLIKGIVDKIDVLLAQVSIQVVIAEVTLSDTQDHERHHRRST
jgi:general secretion pathway protein D